MPASSPSSPSPKPRRRIPADRVGGELLEGQSKALLRELRLLTREGHLNADARRKLKQVNHLCTLLRPALAPLLARHEAPHLIDCGAGNAYLGFILYEVFLGTASAASEARITSIETRADLVERARSRAERLGFNRMAFAHDDLATVAADPSSLGDVHAVLALHACDTATDDAILLGLRAEAPLIAVVPCCQAEVAALLQGQPTRAPLSPLWRHPLHRREFGALLTNIVRAHVLEAVGYKVRVTELVGWEHSLKNELIIATRHQRGNARALASLRKLLDSLPPLPMKLLTSLHPELCGAPTPSEEPP